MYFNSVLCLAIFTYFGHVSSNQSSDTDVVVNDDDYDDDINKVQSKMPKASTAKGDIWDNPVELQEIQRDESEFVKWPLGIVPYYFDVIRFGEYIAKNMRKTMDLVESVSCVRFKPMIHQIQYKTWINFTNPETEMECSHEPIYKDTGEIQMVLGLKCLRSQQLLHTVLHAIGFKDEVCHPHRDQYIHILWENIQTEYRPLFRVQIDEVTSKTLVEYDPLSVMHFHDRAYSKNGQATIAPLLPGLQINPSDTLSHLDKMKLRLLFSRECNKRSVGMLLNSCKMALKNKTPDQEEANGGLNKLLMDEETGGNYVIPDNENQTLLSGSYKGPLGKALDANIDQNETVTNEGNESDNSKIPIIIENVSENEEDHPKELSDTGNVSDNGEHNKEPSEIRNVSENGEHPKETSDTGNVSENSEHPKSDTGNMSEHEGDNTSPAQDIGNVPDI